MDRLLCRGEVGVDVRPLLLLRLGAGVRAAHLVVGPDEEGCRGGSRRLPCVGSGPLGGGDGGR
eukprot:9991631-Lingulodinium_polyedra.AAC.1